MEDEIIYSLALRNCNYIGNIQFSKLIEHTKIAKEAWLLPKTEIQKIPSFGIKKTEEIGSQKRLDFAKKEWEFCQKNNIQILLRHKNELPGGLEQCIDAPSILFQKGNFPSEKNAISMVGTREMSLYGQEFIQKFLSTISHENIATISGLALGVDTCVHRYSLEYNIPTVAVLAHGFSTLYPKENKLLSESILEQEGCLLSEFFSYQHPAREHFLRRNRIVAGISDTTIVVESSIKGGSMSTANFANQYNKEVYALAGNINETTSQGCNQLILDNKARILVSIAQITNELGLQQNPNPENSLQENSKETTKTAEKQKKKPRHHFKQEKENFKTKKRPTDLEKNQELLYNYIEIKEGINLEDLSEMADLSLQESLENLLVLELNGYIYSTSNRCYYLY